MTLPVRELVEFVLRGGSIDNRFGGVDRMAAGSRIHRKLQKAAGDGYQAEVPLSLEDVYKRQVRMRSGFISRILQITISACLCILWML